MNSFDPDAVEGQAYEQSLIGSEEATGTGTSSKPSEPKAAVDAQQVESSELLGSAGRLLIRHRGEQYQLRRTRADKLILTKVDAQRQG